MDRFDCHDFDARQVSEGFLKFIETCPDIPSDYHKRVILKAIAEKPYIRVCIVYFLERYDIDCACVERLRNTMKENMQAARGFFSSMTSSIGSHICISSQIYPLHLVSDFVSQVIMLWVFCFFFMFYNFEDNFVALRVEFGFCSNRVQIIHPVFVIPIEPYATSNQQRERRVIFGKISTRARENTSLVVNSNSLCPQTTPWCSIVTVKKTYVRKTLFLTSLLFSSIYVLFIKRTCTSAAAILLFDGMYSSIMLSWSAGAT